MQPLYTGNPLYQVRYWAPHIFESLLVEENKTLEDVTVGSSNWHFPHFLTICSLNDGLNKNKKNQKLMKTILRCSRTVWWLIIYWFPLVQKYLKIVENSHFPIESQESSSNILFYQIQTPKILNFYNDMEQRRESYCSYSHRFVLCQSPNLLLTSAQ